MFEIVGVGQPWVGTGSCLLIQSILLIIGFFISLKYRLSYPIGTSELLSTLKRNSFSENSIQRSWPLK